MKVLAVDVGRGTQDILLYDPEDELENSLQLILPSRTVLLAERIREATRRGQKVILKGVTMGGGPVGKAAHRHLEAGFLLAATPAASVTFSDDPEEVREMGITVVDDTEADRLAGERDILLLETADVHLGALKTSLAAWGIEPGFDMAVVSVQDHGAAPPGESDRRFRFEYFREKLGSDPELPGQCYDREEIPARFTRMLGVAESLPDMEKLVLMDTGFAALLGACLDGQVAPFDHRVLINIGNGHTLAALVEGVRVRSLFEHHTGKMEPDRFKAYLDDLARGQISG